MILAIVTLIIVLGLVILVHELGHFVAAKKTGVAVEEFGIGYPPRIFGIKRKETIYSLNWFPFGGFVKIKGEQGDNKEDQDSFANKKIWQRAIMISSGVFMNYVLATVLLSIGFFIGLPTVITEDLPLDRVRDQKIQVVSILEESPAAQAGMQIGDTIKAINGQQFETVEEVQQFTHPHLNKEVVITIARGDETLEKKLTLAQIDESGGGKMGTGLVETGVIAYPWYKSIAEGVKTSFYLTGQILVAFYELFKNLIIAQTVPTDIAGPVGIAVITARVARLGFIYILQFTAILSLNLLILNFIPFPALDGGRFLFLIVEKFRGRAMNQRIESIIHTVGFFVLIALVVLVTARDVSRFKDSILGFFKNIVG